MDTLRWSAPEYEDKDRSRDWFWALGVIVVCGAITSVIYGNYFFAALIVMGGFLLGYFAAKKPEIIDYELGPRGLKIGKSLFPYETIKSFTVLIEPKVLLLVHTSRPFLPVISIIIPDDEGFPEEVQGILLAKAVPQDNIIRPHRSETIMDSLGF